MEREEAIEVIRKNRPSEAFTLLREALEVLIPELRECEEEKIRKWIYNLVNNMDPQDDDAEKELDEMKPLALAWLKKQKDTSKAIEAVDRIDKFIDEHLTNAHDMKNSDPDKKYYLGWDAALGNMSGILQDVYSGEKQKEHQNNSDATNESSWAGMISSSDKDKNLDEIAQDYIDGVKEYNPEPTWDLMQTAVCYGYHLAEQKKQKPKPYWHKIKAYEQLPCKAYIYKFAYEQENNFHGKATIKGYLVPNDPVKIGCDTWYLPVEDIKNLQKEDELNTTNLTKTVEQQSAEWSEDWREEDIQTRFAFYTYKDEDGVLYLSNVFVEETSRNHGFGTRILRAAEKVAETIGATTISLKVKQDSPANAWYRKNGYGYVAFEDGYDWLEKNLEYMKPNKQEWNNADNIGWDEALACVTRAKKAAKNEEELQNAVTAEKWLKEIKFKYYVHPVKQEWSEEDEKIIWGLTAYVPNEELERLGITRDDILKKLKSLRPQPIQLKEAYKDGFQTARHAMALAFMKYLDENRPEGKMCLSNSECEEIEKAFLVGDWEKIERYFHKYQWKPSVEQMNTLLSVEGILRSLQYDDKAKILASIYEQLKKLM